MRVTSIFLLITVFCFSACSTMTATGNGKATTIDELRGAAPFDRRTIQVELDREKFQKALELEGSVNDVRLVQIFHRGEAEEELKEYRLLDVRKGSVYDLLNLRQADVLIAADGYVVPNPQVFWDYLRLIARFESANIEIRRGGTPILLKYSFK